MRTKRPLRLRTATCLIGWCALLTACSSDVPATDAQGEDNERASQHARAGAQSGAWGGQLNGGPIEWRPYDNAALAASRVRKKPLVITIGELSCTPCIEMDRDVWRNDRVAQVVNEHYVPIAIDAVQRSDLTDLYQRALAEVTGTSSLPLTIIAAPNGMPIAGGGVFAVDSTDGEMGLVDLLGRVAEDWKADPHGATGRGAQIASRAAGLPPPERLSTLPGPEIQAQTAQTLLLQYDTVNKGYGPGPRFPDRPMYTWLLRHQQPEARQVAAQIADSIVDKSMHDHISGGFFSMTRDPEWRHPSFTKDLTTQAQMALFLLEVWQQSGDSDHAEASRSAIDFMMRELKTPDGTFFASVAPYSTNGATLEHGAPYVWTRDEVLSLTDAVVADWYQIGVNGPIDGRSVPGTSGDHAAFAEQNGMSEPELRERIRTARAALYQARAKRPSPPIDTQVALGPNALAVSALAQASYALDFAPYAEAARVTATHLLRHMIDEDGKLATVEYEGTLGARASLSDHALLAHALIDLFEVTGEGDWLTHAESVLRTVHTDFYDEREGGAYWRTALETTRVFVGDKPWADTNLPAPNGALITALLRLHTHTANPEYRDRAQDTLQVLGGYLEQDPLVGLTLLEGLRWLEEAPLQVVVIPGDGVAEMHDTLRRTPLPRSIRVAVPKGIVQASASTIPLIRDKEAVGGKATVYLCREGVCEPGLTDPTLLQQRLSRPPG